MKKKQIINPLPGKRLKQLLNETRTTQKQLSAKIFLSQQTISQIVTGAASLTPSNAQRIVELFPDYSLEWLLGLSDYKNQKEKNIETFNKIQRDGSSLEAGFYILASLKGFEISNPVERMPEIVHVEEMMKQVKEGYSIRNIQGETCFISVEEMNHLQNDVCDYIEYRLNRWMKKGR